MKNYKKAGGFLTPLFKICSTNEQREKLNYAFVKDGFVVASNGICLIKQNLKSIHDMDDSQIQLIEGKSFHRLLLKEMWKCDTILFHEDFIEGFVKNVRLTFNYSIQVEPYDFVNILSGHEINEVLRIGIQPKQVSILYDVMSGNGNIIFDFNGTEKAIKVYFNKETISDEVGIIMPCLTS